ncbi:MAG: PCMD domain-containing protein [Brumimicrobium sp.]
MKTLLSICLFGMFYSIGFSQQQLQNGDFESWEDSGTAEHEPTNWSSLKTSDDGFLSGMAPEVLSQDAGRNGGFCAKLEVIEVSGINANGILTNGRVHADFNPENGYVFTDAGDARWHTEFTDRPDSIVGWYKYAPQNGDKGKIEIILHTDQGSLPYNGTEANMIARSKFEFTTAQANWTRFSKAFSYVSTDDSEYVLTTITSGDSTISEEGSTLWIDDLSLVYNEDSTNNLENYKQTEIAVNGSNGYLYFDIQDNSTAYTVCDMTGKIIQNGDAKAKVPFEHNSGIYFIRVDTATSSFTKKLYIN